MGEIADMLLDGTMCQGCGEWLHDGEDGPGFPGYCSACQPADAAAAPIEASKPFRCSCGRRFRELDHVYQHRRAKGCDSADWRARPATAAPTAAPAGEIPPGVTFSPLPQDEPFSRRRYLCECGSRFRDTYAASQHRRDVPGAEQEPTVTP